MRCELLVWFQPKMLTGGQYNPVYEFYSSRADIRLQLVDSYAIRDEILTQLYRNVQSWFKLTLSRAPVEFQSTLQASTRIACSRVIELTLRHRNIWHRTMQYPSQIPSSWARRSHLTSQTCSPLQRRRLVRVFHMFFCAALTRRQRKSKALYHGRRTAPKFSRVSSHARSISPVKLVASALPIVVVSHALLAPCWV